METVVPRDTFRMRSLLIALFLTAKISLGFAQSSDSIPQVDVVDIIIRKFKIDLKEKPRDERRIYFSVFPTQSGAGGGGRAIVTSFNAAFYLGEPSTTTISTVYFFPYITFSGKYGFTIRPSLWLSGNKGNFTGDYRILNYPQYTWGLGTNTAEGARTTIQTDYIRFYQTGVLGLTPAWALGLGYMLDHHYNIEEEVMEELGHLDEYYEDVPNNTTSSGISVPLTYNTRVNPINPQKGTYFLLNYRFNTTWLGSDENSQTLYVDGRKYFSFARRKESILGFRSFYWTITSGRVPYLDLPSIGYDPGLVPAGRGIEKGRYRSTAMLYFETEYRFGLSANGLFGAVVFTNITAPARINTQQFPDWHPAAGTGIRLKFNKYSRTNVAFDVAFSKEFFNVYLNIGEAF
jgi:Omp85 superfamily domain